MATAYCDQLRDTFTAMGGCIRSGEIAQALDGFEVIAEPMQKLLVFAVVAADLLRDAQHPLRREVETFARALLEALEHMEAALLSSDFEGLADALEGEVIETLDGYHAIGVRLSVALRPRLAA